MCRSFTDQLPSFASTYAEKYAYINGVDFVRAEDVQQVIKDVFCHRIKISGKARTEGLDTKAVIDELLGVVTPPRQ